MYNFEFYNPTKLVFGKGSIAKLKELLPSDAKIMVTYGGGSVKANGVYDQVEEQLKGFDYIEFWGIEPNPKYETLIKAIELGKKENITFLLAVGGGSVLDGTKFIAAGIPYDGESWDLIKDNSKAITTIPLASVMTLPATGSEMNNGAVISRLETEEKFAFFTPTNFPQFSILDPETTYSLPAFQVACGVIDTFVHTVEQYMTFPVEALLMDRWAEGILQTLKDVSDTLMHEEKPDYETRSNYMLCATMALNGFISMGVPQDWATHMIGHELTAFTGLTHGVTLAIVYPALLRVMKEEKMDKLLQYGARVWQITIGTPEERAEQTIMRTESFFNSLGIATHLSDYHVDRTVIDKIVERFKNRKWKLGEKQNIDYHVVAKILDMAY
ncbi:MAG: iron-containing alcohol dehydrogenase [Bacteroidales bacterium]